LQNWIAIISGIVALIVVIFAFVFFIRRNKKEDTSKKTKVKNV
jgi:LPXTG-motif cell wall-anchored protein